MKIISTKYVVNHLRSADTKETWKFWTQRRYIVMIMVHLATANMFIMRINLSVAIVQMSNDYFDWSSKEKGIILSSFFYGYILTQLPGGVLSKRYSAHHIFGGCIGMCAILTLLTPLLAFNFYTFVAVRIIEGVILGTTFPTIIAIVYKWAPPLERSRMIMVANSGIYSGTVIAMSGSGVVGEYFGWESIFYVSGVIALFWYFLWCFTVNESPEKDPWISEEEKTYILASIASNTSSFSTQIPWLRIMSSIAVWGLIVVHFAQCWGAYTLLTQMPMFLSDTINMRLSSTGLYSCLPYIFTGVISIPVGLLSDKLEEKKLLSRLNVRRCLIGISFSVQAIFMVAIAYLRNPIGSIVCLVIASGFSALAMPGYTTNFIDLAPQYSMVLFGLSNGFATLGGIVSPILTGYIVQNKSPDEWEYVFYLAATIYLVGLIVYYMTATVELQSWAKNTKSCEKNSVICPS